MHARLRLVASTLLVLLAATAGAQPALPLLDIAPGEPATGLSSAPRHLTPIAGKLFFSAEEPGTGRELWVSDGTPYGTELLADLCPGSCSSDPVPLGALGNLLLFRIADGRLFRSDGTRAGTFELPAATPSLAILGRAAFFPVCGADDCRLYTTDGSIAGTRPAVDLGRHGVLLPVLEGPYAAGRHLYWVQRGWSGSPGRLVLWKSDGTAAGTSMAELPAMPRLFTVAAERMFFLARGEQGEELWTSDGTAAGTRRISAFSPDAPFAATGGLEAGAAGVYFAADDGTHGAEVWKSDGTAAGTVRVTALAPSQPFLPLLDPLQIEELGGRLLVIGYDPDLGYRLYASQGTPASTRLLGAAAVSPNTGLVEAGGRVFFRADDGAHGYEPWSTTGTAAGTAMTRDLCPGPCGSQLTIPQGLGGRVVFLASDFVHGPQLFESDGTAAGTRARTALPRGALAAEDFEVAALGGELYFAATDRRGEELWSTGAADSGGTAGGEIIADLAGSGSSAAPREPARVGERFVFTACDGRSREVWASDGTPQGTTRLTGFLAPDGCGSTPERAPSQLTSDGTTAYFWAWTGDVPWLWRTDGTPAGTQGVFGWSGFRPGLGLFVHGGRAFFPLYRGDTLGELWTSDGTAEGTRRLSALPDRLAGSRIYLTWWGGSLYAGLPYLWVGISGGLYRSAGGVAELVALHPGADFQDPPRFTEYGGRLFFLARKEGGTLRLWQTDGTAAGTRLHSSSEDIQGNVDLAVFGGRLYYLEISYPSFTTELWSTDGTEAGTSRVARLPGEIGPEAWPGELTVAAGRLFFVADDRVHGRELWTSDGTSGGTVLVRDLFPGITPSSPSGLAAFAGKLVFAANDGVHGRELWTSDGSAAGTRLAHDVAPGALSSAPASLFALAERLFFTADDGVSGRELWVLSATGMGCQPAPDRLCLGGGRFAVTVAWRDFAGNTGAGQALPLTGESGDTGGFWFFSPENLELAVKVLDGRPLNQAFWVFYGALSSVGYEITVTDTETGLTRRYQNPEGQLASVGDTRGFGPLGAFSVADLSSAFSAETGGRTVAKAACTPGPARLCLAGGRFAVEVAWTDFSGQTGTGTAFPLTGDTGAFWFFAPGNLELFAKVLDGRALNGRFWFFYGALSSVEYEIRVTDTETGTLRTYRNPAGRLASVGDTAAF